MESKKIYCYECKNLEFSECYGDCAAGHRSIVNPYDSCEFAQKRETYVASEPPILNAALIRFQNDQFVVHKYCTFEDAKIVMEMEKKNPDYIGASWTIVDFTIEMSMAVRKEYR